jgi:hypothetical protein
VKSNHRLSTWSDDSVPQQSDAFALDTEPRKKWTYRNGVASLDELFYIHPAVTNILDHRRTCQKLRKTNLARNVVIRETMACRPSCSCAMSHAPCRKKSCPCTVQTLGRHQGSCDRVRSSAVNTKLPQESEVVRFRLTDS